MIHDYQREGAIPGRGDLYQGHLQPSGVGTLVVDLAGDPFGHQVRVGGGNVHSEVGSQLLGVGQVSVVTKGDRGIADLAVGRLSVGPIVGSGRGVSGMPDSDVSVQPCEGGLIEDLGDEPQVLEDRDRFAIGGSYPGRLLTSMLQCEQPEVDDVGDPLVWRVCSKDPAGLAGPVQQRDCCVLRHNPMVGLRQHGVDLHLHRIQEDFAICGGQLEIMFHTIVGVLDFGLGQVSDRSCRDPNRKRPGRHFLALREHRAGGQPCPFSHDGAVECPGSDSDKCPVFDRRSVDHCGMADGHAVTDPGGDVFIAVDHNVVLDVGLGTNTDPVELCPYHRTEENEGPRSDLDVAVDVGTG